ncbi:hypothetical protein, partial [Pelagicoccus sp. SDUM812002]|uniref:hypothetical protein n=1 Tax=Pelagicoccus sp. SDUM812002 TaxID=3041266 RepID=UPI00280E8732
RWAERMKAIQQKVSTLTDGETLILLNELQVVTGQKLRDYPTSMLQHYLQACIFPNGGSEKAVKISKSDLDALNPTENPVLQKKIKSIGDDLFQIMKELCELNYDSIENHMGSSIYMVLNKTLAPTKSKKNPRLFKY